MRRTLSRQEARVVLTLEERRQYEVTRKDIIGILSSGVKAADHVISALREKGWLERVHWGKYKLYPCKDGAMYVSFDPKCKV